MMGLPMMLSTPTGEVRKGLCGGGPATGLAASPDTHSADTFTEQQQIFISKCTAADMHQCQQVLK